MKDIFVSKIKRLAVAIFAALCVGSAWGQVVLEVNEPLVIKSDGTLEVSYTIFYYGTSSLRNFYFDSSRLNPNPFNLTILNAFCICPTE